MKPPMMRLITRFQGRGGLRVIDGAAVLK